MLAALGLPPDIGDIVVGYARELCGVQKHSLKGFNFGGHITFIPNGDIVFTSKSTLKRFKREDEKSSLEITLPKWAIALVYFDNKLAVTTVCDKEITVWDLVGKSWSQYHGHRLPPRYLIELSNGLLASGSECVHVWDQGKSLFKLEKAVKNMVALEKGAFATYAFDLKIQVWSARGKKRRTLVPKEKPSVVSDVYLVALENQQLASSFTLAKTVEIWDHATGTLVSGLITAPSRKSDGQIHESTVGKAHVFGFPDSQVHESKEVYAPPPIPKDDEANASGLLGKCITVCGGFWVKGGAAARQGCLAVSTQDGITCIPTDGAPFKIPKPEFARQITCLAWVGENLFFTCCNDTTIFMWNTKIIKTLKGHKCANVYGNPFGILCLVALNDTTLLSGSSDCTARVWQTKGEIEHFVCEHETHVSIAAPLQNGIFATGARGNVIKVWSAEGKLLHQLGTVLCEGFGVQGVVHGITAVGDDRVATWLSFDPKIQIWHTMTGALLHQIPASTGIHLATLATGILVAAVKNWVRVTINVYTPDLCLIKTFETQKFDCSLVPFPDGKLAVADKDAGTVEVWQ